MLTDVKVLSPELVRAMRYGGQDSKVMHELKS